MVSINVVEIPTADLASAVAFYSAVFAIELEIVDVEGEQMCFFPESAETGSATVAITQGEGYRPGPDRIRLYLTVDDVDATLSRAVAHGATVVSEVDEVPVWARFAQFADSEGTVIGIAQPLHAVEVAGAHDADGE